MKQKKRRIRWKAVIILALALITLVLLTLTPWFNQLANTQRATPGVGGECLLWVFPAGAMIVLLKN